MPHARELIFRPSRQRDSTHRFVLPRRWRLIALNIKRKPSHFCRTHLTKRRIFRRPILRNLRKHARRSRSRSDRSLNLYLVLAGLLLVAATLVAADTLTGEASGGIQDVENDNPIASASVTLTNVERGWKKRGASDKDGQYVF